MRFFAKRQRPIPEAAQEILDSIPEEFEDDACSNAPDGVFGFDFSWVCRIHDWRFCTRCHRAGSLDWDSYKASNRELRRLIRLTLPWWLRHLVSHLYYWIVVPFGAFAAFDSCGVVPDGATDEQLVNGVCRHNMPRPSWMDGSG